MADVTERNRGQLIIISALVIAALFVVLALVVNGAIYAENFATRDTGGDTRDVLEQRSNVEHEVQRVVDRANSNESLAIADAEKQINYNVDNLSTSMTRSEAAWGKVVEVNVTDTTRGEQLRQQDPDRNFTAGGVNSGAPDWTLAENTTEAGKFEMVVNEKDLLNASSDAANQLLVDGDKMFLGGLIFNEAFHVNVTNETGHNWNVYMFQAPEYGENKVYIYTQQPGEDIITLNKSLRALALNESCSGQLTDGNTTIDLREGTVGGERCSNLGFYQEEVVGSPHNISFNNTRTEGLEISDAKKVVDEFDSEGRLDDLDNELDNLVNLLGLGDILDTDDPEDELVKVWDDLGFSGDRVSGKYEIIVNREHSQTTEDNFYSLDEGEPSSRTVVFSTDAKMVYRSGDATLTTDGVEVKWSVADS